MIEKAKKIISFVKNNIYLLVVALGAFLLRFVNLGYSDYQGDEIKALYTPSQTDTFFTYLMDQRKGPIQFVVTYLLKFIDPTYENEFLIRLPFALAGVLAVVFFYKLVSKHFGEKIAFYASFLMATNGFFIAFSRIVQYQSFVILFMVLSLYFLTLATTDKKYQIRGIYLGLISWAISILSHYDGGLIFPFVFYLLFKWFKLQDISKKDKIKHFLLSGVLSFTLLASFYIPFVLSLSEATMDYWAGRIAGDVSSKISSSRYLFTVYQPIYSIHIYTILTVLGMLFIIYAFSSNFIKFEKLPSFIQYFSQRTTNLVNDIKSNRDKIIALFLWFLVAFLFMEAFVSIPGTHIYTYLLPLFIFTAFGIVTIESLIQKIFELPIVYFLNFVGIFIVFAFLFAQSYAVFVDNHEEYPWEDETFLFWTFTKPTPIYHLSMFGFPYYRNWEGIRDFIKTIPEYSSYSTNERKTIARYYVPLDKSSDRAGFYIYIKDPQSFTNEIINEKPAYWTEKYEPVFTISRDGRATVRVYVMEPGTLEEIMQKGF